MAFVQTLEKYLIKFGANNSPTFVAMSIAAAKGIFRPAFTMTDKQENYETFIDCPLRILALYMKLSSRIHFGCFDIFEVSLFFLL